MAEGVTPGAAGPLQEPVGVPLAQHVTSPAVIDYQTPRVVDYQPIVTPRDDNWMLLRRGLVSVLRVVLTIAIGMTLVVGVVVSVVPFLVWLAYDERLRWDMFASGVGIIAAAMAAIFVGNRLIRWLLP